MYALTKDYKIININSSLYKREGEKVLSNKNGKWEDINAIEISPSPYGFIKEGCLVEVQYRVDNRNLRKLFKTIYSSYKRIEDNREIYYFNTTGWANACVHQTNIKAMFIQDKKGNLIRVGMDV